MEALKRFSQNVIDTMRSDIKDADGNEVFWAGKIDLEGIVVSLHAGSRGNENSVVVNKNTAKEGNVIIHNHPSGNLSPSEADQNIAYNASDSSLGFYIVDNDVSRVYVVVEPVKPKKIELLNEDETAFFLSCQGPFAKSYGNYEERPAQISLSKETIKAARRCIDRMIELG